MKFNTKTIHGGQHHDPATGAVMPPVYQTSTFVQTSPGQPLNPDYEYSRAANPTRSALENALASIENGVRGLARSEEHTSELQSRQSISYAVFCLKKKNFFNDTATTEIYTGINTLSLHDALPISIGFTKA